MSMGDQSPKSTITDPRQLESFADTQNSFASSVTSSASLFSQSPIGLKGERNLEWKHDNKCYICNKKFNLTTRRHHCRYCGNSICKDHSLKRLSDEDQKETRICVNCDRELIKNEIQEEIQAEIAKLQLEAQQGRDTNEKLYKEQSEKNARVNELEEELTRAERIQRSKEQELQNKLQEEQTKGEKAREKVDELRKALEESHNSERDINDKCNEAENTLEKLKTEEETLKDRKNELTQQIEDLNKRLKGSLPLDQVRNVLCQRCVGRLNQIYRPNLFNNGAIPEEDSEYAASKGSIYDK
ncbi:unnamed protein product [Blepharisma stoltei]|uniref:FYVE-type domain-containing protein n=1 Tax=Blepharisma stoltei TaxID=1481888 RepID=A0AAU9KCN7_9CILI|nr:unnamed protein product [Blepharisma stoltei]